MKALGIIVFLLTSLSLSAQVDTTSNTDTTSTKSTRDNPFGLKVEPEVKQLMLERNWDELNNWRGLDSMSDSFHSYNPLYQGPLIRHDLGNVGSASYNLLHRQSGVLGNEIDLSILNPYLIGSGELKIFKTPTPFTEFTYTSGQFFGLDNAEHLLKIRHTQNPTENLNLHFGYRRLVYNGNYQHQRNSYHQAEAGFSFFAPKLPYAVQFGAYLNKVDLELNGGTTSDTFFTADRFSRRTEVDVNLKTTTNEIKDRGLKVRQFASLGGGFNGGGSETQGHRLFHEFEYQHRAYRFFDSDVDSVYYDSSFLLSADSTHDQIYYDGYKNSFGWQMLNEGSMGELGAVVGFTYDFKQLLQAPGRSTLSDQWLFAKVNLSDYPQGNGKLSAKFEGQYHLGERNQGQYLGKLDLGFDYAQLRFGVNLHSSSQGPSLMERFYYSNHGLWLNDFENQKHFRARFTLEAKKTGTRISAQLDNSKDVVYWDMDGSPQQFGNSFSTLLVGLEQKFNWKKLHFDNSLFYQNSLEDGPVDLPDFIIKSDLYFRGKVFKEALFMQAGLVGHWHEQIADRTYLVPFGQFTESSGTNAHSPYPLIDAYMSFEIQELSFFIKMEHLNQGLLFPEGNFAFSNYPIADRNFKLGLNWRFWL